MLALPLLKNLKSLTLQGLLLLLSTLLITACAIGNQQSQQVTFSGFGGTGHSINGGEEAAGDSGFGGTGHGAQGFGGTGIIGTISAFGSIWVNGIEIEYDPTTPIKNPLGTEPPLKLGQQVVVVTQEESDSPNPLAKQIQVFVPIAGKISQRQGNLITVEGQTITIQGRTLLDKEVDLTPGHYIAINGYRTARGTWIATRVNQNPLHKSWVKSEIPLSFNPKVQQIIIQPELVTMIRDIQSSQQVMSQIKQQGNMIHHQAIILQGEWQGERFTPQKINFIHNQPKIMPTPAIPRPHKMEGITQHLEMPDDLYQQIEQVEQRYEVQAQQQLMDKIHSQKLQMQEMQAQHQRIKEMLEQQQHSQEIQEHLQQMQNPKESHQMY